jgi:hypothetical protein
VELPFIGSVLAIDDGTARENMSVMAVRIDITLIWTSPFLVVRRNLIGCSAEATIFKYDFKNFFFRHPT